MASKHCVSLMEHRCMTGFAYVGRFKQTWASGACESRAQSWWVKVNGGNIARCCLLGAAVEGLVLVAYLRRGAAADAGLGGGAGLLETRAAGMNLVLPCCTKV